MHDRPWLTKNSMLAVHFIAVYWSMGSVLHWMEKRYLANSLLCVPFFPSLCLILECKQIDLWRKRMNDNCSIMIPNEYYACVLRIVAIPRNMNKTLKWRINDIWNQRQYIFVDAHLIHLHRLRILNFILCHTDMISANELKVNSDIITEHEHVRNT